MFSIDEVDGEKKKGSEWADTDRDYTYGEVRMKVFVKYETKLREMFICVINGMLIMHNLENLNHNMLSVNECHLSSKMGWGILFIA